MDARLFHRRLYESARALLPPGAAVVCAVSGGADSMAMLHGLHAVNLRRRRGWRLVVAHLDHGLRGDSAAARRFVEAAAAELGLTVVSESADVAELARLGRRSIEEAGRERRYAFFAEAARRCGAAYVAVAHHADDQAETVLHRVLRGTGLRGLGGIPRVRRISPGSDIRVVRPMLSFEREELHAYLRGRGLGYMEDSTNVDLSAALRNRLRHEVLPRLERVVNPQARRALVRLSEQARSASRAIRLAARQALAEAMDAARRSGRRGNAARRFSTDGATSSCLVSVVPLCGLPLAIQSEVVIVLLGRLGWRRRAMTAERIAAAAALFRADGRRRRVELPGGRFERSGEWVCVARHRSDEDVAPGNTPAAPLEITTPVSPGGAGH
jgi:tRNA(Ile)-lysidine synthetase-like protein